MKYLILRLFGEVAIYAHQTSLLVISILFSFSIAQAHQPDISSTMLVEQKNGSWILQVRAALIAFEYEVHTHYGKDSYTTPEKFQELAINHLKQNIVIHFNQQDTAIFQNAYVKLGHETNAVFEVLGIPETFHSISVKNSSFKDIHSNQSALIILKKGFHKEQFILNEANKHTANLMAQDAKFVPYTTNLPFSTTTSWLLYVVIAGLVIGILGKLLSK